MSCGGIELARQLALSMFELAEQLRRNGEQIAAGQFFNLTNVAEARAHHDRLVSEFLEVVVDPRYRLHPGIVGALVILARVFLVPVKNAAHERRDKCNARIGGGNGLMYAE